MAEQWDLDEEGIRRLGALSLEQPGRVRTGGPGRGAWGPEAEGRKLRQRWGNLRLTRGNGAEERSLRQRRGY